MAVSIYKLIIAVFGIVVMLALLSPAIFQYGSPQFASKLNFTQANATGQINQNFFQPLNQTSFGGSNHTGGFFANIQVFNGLAFVFSGIGSVMLAILNLPRIMILILGTSLTVLDVPTATASFMIGLFFEMILTVLILIGISAWMKFDLRS